jgi:DNA-binding MarR family transcriptional regulator
MTASEPRWLTPAEQRAWRSLARILFRLPAALDAQLQRESRLSHFEYMVLACLSEAPGRTLRMSDLAAMAHGSLSRLSHVVKRLEKRDWVHRSPCVEDGRYINATLTDSGYAKLVDSAPGHVAAVRTLVVDTLSAGQIEELAEIGGRIAEALDRNG